jgi:hypothetical protein
MISENRARGQVEEFEFAPAGTYPPMSIEEMLQAEEGESISGSPEFDIPGAIKEMLQAKKPPYSYTAEEKKPWYMKSVPSYYKTAFERVYAHLSEDEWLEIGHVVCACGLHGLKGLMASEEVREYIALTKEVPITYMGSMEQTRIRRHLKDWRYKPEEHGHGNEPWSIKVDPGIIDHFERCMGRLRFPSKAAFLIPCIGAGLAGQTGCHPDFTDYMKKEQERQLRAIAEQSRLARMEFDALK